MQLFLIRHAQSTNNAFPPSYRVEDPGLTRLGREQARRVGERLRDLGVNRIITSPFLRTLQTSEHAEQSTGIVPEVRIPLHEKGGCIAGINETEMVGRPGMTGEEIATHFPSYRIGPEIDGQGWWGGKPMETMAEARRRAVWLIEETCKEFGATDERIAYVIHGDLILLIMRHLHPQPVNLAWNSSLTRIKVNPERAVLEEYASVTHLPNYLVTW